MMANITMAERSMAPKSRFWDKHARGYAKRPVADQASYETKLRVTQEYLKPDMDVLELGCGTGTTALIHAPFVKHIRATDISDGMLEIAREKAAAGRVENVTFERASVDGLIAADGSYDAVMTHSLLHLLEDKEPAIAKIHRLLKPGGLFVSSTVCLNGKWRLLQPVLRLGRLFGLLPLVRFFTPDELCRAIESAGFRIDHRWQPAKSKAVFVVAKRP